MHVNFDLISACSLDLIARILLFKAREEIVRDEAIRERSKSIEQQR